MIEFSSQIGRRPIRLALVFIILTILETQPQFGQTPKEAHIIPDKFFKLISLKSSSRRLRLKMSIHHIFCNENTV